MCSKWTIRNFNPITSYDLYFSIAFVTVDIKDNNGILHLAALDSYQNTMYTWKTVIRKVVNGVRGLMTANVLVVAVEELHFRQENV